MQVKLTPTWADRTVTLQCRAGSDLDAIKEVVDKRVYRKAMIGLDVEPGEHWLDLGANIGSFAAYCFLRGATADCYEPEDSCFKLLEKNISKMGKGFNLHQTAITARKEKRLPAWKSSNPENHYRLTIIPVSTYVTAPPIPNVHASILQKQTWDGVKADIEGSELALIEQDLIPKTSKLSMEYHFSRQGRDMAKFHYHMRLLKKKYEIVKYPPFLDKVKKGEYPGRFDIIVHCINR